MEEEAEAALMRAGAQIEALRSERDAANESMHSALRLVTDVRWALGDEGARMQTELIEHAAELRKDAERLHTALETIATMPMEEQDNMLAANMRNVARAALACKGVTMTTDLAGGTID